jgi:methionyl-tRNA formyltransferase
MSEIRIILLCGSRFAIPALQELAFFKQLSVIAIPRHCTEMIERVKVSLTGMNVPVIEIDKETLEKQLKDAIEKYKITTGLVMSFSYSIPASVFILPPNGFFNVHPGPLPRYRGADPVFQQIKNKERKAGVTIHKLDEGFDTGPVVINEMIAIDPADTYGILTSKLSITAGRVVRTLCKLLGFDLAVPSRPQDESKATYFKKQSAKDVIIDWMTMDADSVIALINACNPWNKGALTKINQKIIRLLEAEKLAGYELPENTMAGTVIAIDEKGMIVSANGHEAIRVFTVYIDEGFFRASLLNKLGIIPGNRFEMI